jgi:radical SAM protein with 4Fe4S-binding SPASM domain
MNKKPVKLSEYLYFQEVDAGNGICAAWNRFYPTLFLMNPYALELLDAIKENKKIEGGDEIQAFFDGLFQYKFIYEGERDPSREEFTRMMDRELAAVKDNGERFYAAGGGYDGLGIYTDDCNLTCGYCVNRYKRKHRPVKKNFHEKLEIIDRCIAQYLCRRPGDPAGPVKIFFSGGEILLEWPLIKTVVGRILDKYDGLPFEFSVNTNLTLMTEEIAEFLGRHHFRIDVSIDGYGDAHDRTRQYGGGKSSFAGVLRGLEMLRKYNNVDRFQGVVEHVDQFSPGQVYEMEKYGFVEARLAPNLLAVSQGDALKKAGLMGKFLELNEQRRLQVTEFFFSNAREKINREPYRFLFYCRGLCCLPEMVLSLNISTMRVSQLCHYVPGASLSLEEMKYDIYDKKLWERSYRFIQQRLEAIKNHCFDCHLVGLCGGGCIYTGLDKENQVNEAACAFQKKLWNIYINKIYRDRSTG